MIRIMRRFFSSPNTGVHKLIVKSHRWQKSAIAAAVLLGLWGSNAMAFSLGRITVQSGLGEPLRAEIDVPDINAQEAASLKAAIASPAVFRAAGLDYSPAISSLQVSLQKRNDGRYYLRLRGDQAINEPFVDVILEANWATGRIVRDYTLLFDPPGLKQAAKPTPAQIPAPSASSASVSRPTPQAPALQPSATTQPAEPRQSNIRPSARPAATPGGQVTVKSGDTAGKIALAAKPVNVSLDQMLVALLRTNPAAFGGDNVNRMRAGAVLNLPTPEQVEATPAREATQIIVAQSKDFNEFRRQLADRAPSTEVAGAGRTASGSVQAQVEDKKPATTAPDKLTLSKGAVQGKSAEDQLADKRNAEESASRAAEIAKNISELAALSAASGAAAPVAVASAASPAPVAPSISAGVVTPPMPPASAAVVAAAVPPPAAALVIPPETDLLDELTENPLVPAGAIGLILLLAGLGLYRVGQRKKAAQADSSYLESSIQHDSLFAANGGQSVDTSETAATASAMMYSPSQLDDSGDVDPVAEADVYLAYGRDVQAEEILKEALEADPDRIALHQKLLEIYAKRRDVKGFEEIATQASRITDHNGPAWERICELGLSIDPGNGLYQRDGQDKPLNGTLSTLPAAVGLTPALTEQSQPLPPLTTAQANESVDLDLDFSLDEEPAGVSSGIPARAPIAPIEPTAPVVTAAAPNTEPVQSVDMDFGLIDEAPESLAAAPAPAPAPEPQQTSVDFDFDMGTDEPEPLAPTARPATNLEESLDFALPDLEFTGSDLSAPTAPDIAEVKLQATEAPARLDSPSAPAPLTTPQPVAPPASDFGMLEFDLGSLSLDLGDKPETVALSVPSAPEDPMATKLALAEEFSAIGDDEGARALFEEVIAEASGETKIKAQRALSNL